MNSAAVIVFGLLAIPQVLGSKPNPFRTDFDYTKLRGGIDPEILKRHVYVFSEFCPAMTRVMEFGDEVLIASQRPWEKAYAPNKTCVMHVDRPIDVGIIYNPLVEDTFDCQDVLQVTLVGENPQKYCGPESNVTGSATTVFNQSIIFEWRTADRPTPAEHTKGFAMLLTAFQYQCRPGQSCFPCVNGLVIDQVHMCNGYDNCGDNSDENHCPPDPPLPGPVPTPKPHNLPTNSGAVVGLSVGLSMLAAACIFLGIMWYKAARSSGNHDALENANSP